MGSIDPLPHLSQVCLGASKKSGALISATNASREDRTHVDEVYRSVIFQYSGGPDNLPYPWRFMCPHPILVSAQFTTDLKKFHDALASALNNIVQRWLTDEEAAFPTRMPLEPHEEKLLRWVYQCSEENITHGFDGHQGNWRPDLLIPAEGTEKFQLCEINARFPFNGIDLTSWIYKALGNPEIKPPFLDTAEDPDLMFDGVFTLFNPELPMYFLRDQENTVMLEAFLDLVGKKTGIRPRVIHPNDLRLVPDASSATGYALYTTNPALSTDGDEKLEKIYQIGLQLYFDEYVSVPPEIQQHLTLYGVNDMRSILLIHDKRLLGVLHQELDALVTKHHVLTEEQADLLRKGVIPTIIPGSEELHQLIDSHHQGKVTKDDFILKPVRGSRGAGILFGDELSVSEWEAILNSQKNPELSPDRTLYVIQPIVKQIEQELFLDEEIGTQTCQQVGSYHVVNGKFHGLGVWRVAVLGQRTCNMATGEAWKLGSVVSTHD